MFRSTKGASKQRRDLINGEISVLRDLLPLPEAARQRLSQLQIMSLGCVFIRKCNFFSRIFGDSDAPNESNFEFAQTMTGFILVASRDGKLLYISDNVTEYLGHSMVDMMTQGDSVYDIIDKRDHQLVQNQLLSGPTTAQAPGQAREERTFFCKMNVARSFRRQAGFGDHKMMHVKGHFVQPMVRDHYGNQPVFMAICSPLITPDVKETAIQNSTSTFYSVHGLDMAYTEIGHIGEFHLGYDESEMVGKSWYSLLHPEDIHEAKEKHVQLIKSSHEMGCMLTARLQSKYGAWVWVNIVMHIRQPFVCDNGDPAIVCINHVIDDNDAQLFKIQSQLYSSHIARSPEFLGSPQGTSPQHTITQVPMEGSAFSSGHAYPGQLSHSSSEEGQALPYSVSFITTGSSTHPPAPSTTGVDQQPRSGTPMYLESASDSGSSNSPKQHNEDKQRLRADLVNKLKRKLSDSSNGHQHCRPKKVRVINNGINGDMSSDATSYQASAFITDVSLLNNIGHGFSAMSSGDVQVLAPVQEGPIYQNLVLKKEAILNQKNADMILATVVPQQLAIGTTMKPPTPLTPDSMIGDAVAESTTQLLTVDVSDASTLPSSFMTPEASPVSIYEDLVGSPLSDDDQVLENTMINELNEMTFFEDVASKMKTPIAMVPNSSTLSVNQTEVENFPIIDTVSLEQMLCDLESMPDESDALAAVSPPPPVKHVVPPIASPAPICPADANENLNHVVTKALMDMVQLAVEGSFDLRQFVSVPESVSPRPPSDMKESTEIPNNLIIKVEDALGDYDGLAMMTSPTSTIEEELSILDVQHIAELDLLPPPPYGECDLTSSLLA